MELNKKNYDTKKIKKYFKLNKLFFFFNGANKNSIKWLKIEQEIKSFGYKLYKISNKTTQQTLNNSVYLNVKPLFNGLNYVIKPLSNYYKLTKDILKKKFEPLFFIILAIKINNNIYTGTKIKKIKSLTYKENKLLFYQFAITHLKNYYK